MVDVVFGNELLKKTPKLLITKNITALAKDAPAKPTYDLFLSKEIQFQPLQSCLSKGEPFLLN